MIVTRPVAMAAVVAVWADEQIQDTGRHIATVTPLARHTTPKRPATRGLAPRSPG